MKKPSKPRRSPARGTIKSRAPSPSKAARKPRARRPRYEGSLAPKRASSRASTPCAPRAATVYSTEERRALLLLLVPFVVMTLAIGMSQVFMHRGIPALQVAHAVRTAEVLRVASPKEMHTTSGEAYHLLTPSDAHHGVNMVRPNVVVEASLPLSALHASQVAVQVESLRPFAQLDVSLLPSISRASLLPANLETPPPAEVAARAASAAALSRCKAPWATAEKLQQNTVAFIDLAKFGRQLARAARAQTRDLVIYRDKYQTISFPMGDVPPMYGVCTDVVIRAYRSLGIDLQVLVHKARLGTGDTSIDHRRTKTLRRFFEKHGTSIPVTEFPEDYRPGDIVTYRQPLGRGSQSHIAIVSDVFAASGRPMIIHNRGWGPQIEDALFYNQITGHYRYSGPARSEKATNSRSMAAERSRMKETLY